MAECARKKKDKRCGSPREATALRAAINRHLLDPKTGLYYLNIDVDGRPRYQRYVRHAVPGHARRRRPRTAARIISRLSIPSFWTEAGIRTVPRDDIEYSPTRSWGLLGGVWVGVTFRYAFAAARFNPGFMAYALGTSFQHYSRDPGATTPCRGSSPSGCTARRSANQGMMLSPWYPPRYVWSAIEGACGLRPRRPATRVFAASAAAMEVARRAQPAVSRQAANAGSSRGCPSRRCTPTSNARPISQPARLWSRRFADASLGGRRDRDRAAARKEHRHPHRQHGVAHDHHAAAFCAPAARPLPRALFYQPVSASGGTASTLTAATSSAASPWTLTRWASA